jgi:hypothetical protein
MRFIAQNLDNESDDIVAINRELLNPIATSDRVAVVSHLSRGTSEGKAFKQQGSIVVWRNASYWVLKITPEVLDSAGRRAPFLCGIEDDEILDSDEWPSRALEEIEWFCGEVGRELGESGWSDLKGALSYIKKKPLLSEREKRILAFGAVIGLTLTVLIWVLVTR